VKKNKKILVLLLFLVLILTGCTTQLKDSDNNVVKNEKTGQNLTENIICRPTSKEAIKLYEANGVDLEKLPDCKKMQLSGNYEGIWTNIFIRPLAILLINVGKNIGSYALSIILISIVIRLISYPLTRKTAMQSESMKEAQPEIQRVQKKYGDKKDQESMTKQSQEMMAIYKKYNINPLSGCLFSLIQLPILLAFFEAIQRTPALFEDKFLGLQLGTVPAVGISSPTFYMYIILMLLIGATTYFSFKLNMAGNPTMDGNMKMMPIIMTGMIIVMGVFMPSALGIYWITTNVFAIVQSILVKRSKKKNGKA